VTALKFFQDILGKILTHFISTTCIAQTENLQTFWVKVSPSFPWPNLIMIDLCRKDFRRTGSRLYKSTITFQMPQMGVDVELCYHHVWSWITKCAFVRVCVHVCLCEEATAFLLQFNLLFSGSARSCRADQYI